ncbi:MAG: tetratricopeptide repeat protein [Blastocatellia bacterium]|nr:tetratricopeptide repeat protein [Blastocatellia bacterium]
MTISYCGKCGSANGTSARFCRQCGVELGSYTAFSAHSTPMNVEFFPRTGGTKDIREDLRENLRRNLDNDQPQAEQIDISAKGSLASDPSAAPPADNEGKSQPDPVAISKSLRHVRASGSLILEASKKNQDEMNAIISLAIEGFDKQSGQLPPEPPPPPPRGNPVFGRLKRRRPLALPPKEIPSATQPLVAMSEAVQAVWRKAVNVMTTPARVSSVGSNLNASANSLVPNGPSTVLAQASGLNTRRSLSPKLISGLIALTLLIGIGFYQVIRDRLLSPDQQTNSQRELESAEDQSEKNVQLGKDASEKGDYNAALIYFNKAVSLTPNKSEAVFLIAQTYAKAGQIRDALQAYKAVLQIEPEHLQARLNVAQIYRALGNWNAAYQEFQRIIALDQNSEEANVALGAIEAQQASLPQASEPLVRPRPVVKKRPILPPPAAAESRMTFLSQVAPTTQTIRPPEAGSDKKEETLDPQAVADARIKMGLRFLQINQYRAAITEFLAALRLTPNDKDIYYFLGTAFSGLGQPEQAYEYYKRVDSGQYLQVSIAGAKKTEKAAKVAAKRRSDLKNDELKNDLGIELQNESGKNNEGSNPLSRMIFSIFK